jgi:hypothetical protein
MRNIIVTICLICVTSLFVVGCDKINHDSETTSNGVVFHGYNTLSETDDCGWIQNNNDFSVRITEVYVSDRGELTQWIKLIQPGEKISETMHPSYGFYIHDLNGVEIGFVRPTNRI